MYNGIDVSKHQKKIDWTKVKKDFAIIRCGYANSDGTVTEDAYFKTNMEGALLQGIPCGVYLYSYLNDTAAAEKAARQALEMVKPYRLLYPLIFDFEHENRNNSKYKKANAEIIRTVLNVWENAGYYAMWYTYKAFYTYAVDTEMLKPYDFWLAHYTAAGKKTDFNKPFGMWQYSSRGTCAGIAGNVDLSYSYRNYPDIIQKNCLNGTGSVDVLFNDIRPADAAKILKWAQENGLKAVQYDGRRF